MSWEGFWVFIAVLVGGPLVLATVVVVTTVCAVCAVPVGVVWGLAALVRPSVLRAALPSWPPMGPETVTDRAPARGEEDTRA